VSEPGSAAWPAYLSKDASGVLAQLPPGVQELVRDALALAGRAPYGWPQWQPADPDGADVRIAQIGAVSVVYWVNRQLSRLWVLGIVWVG
jgi:hypothetical protein